APVPPSAPTPGGTIIPIGRTGEPIVADARSTPVDAPIVLAGDIAPAGSARISVVGIGGELDPLRAAKSDSSSAADKAARAALDLKLVDSSLTLPGDHAFRIVVSRADEAALMVFHGIPDQAFAPETEVSFRIPQDAFVHTRASATVTLRATLADGRPLPK